VRLALISDVHGNAIALEAALADVEQVGVDGGVCLGDVAQGGPQPAEVLERLQELGWPAVRGNSDEFLLRLRDDDPEPLTPALLEVRDWTLGRLDAGALEYLDSFQPTVGVELARGRTLLACHGSPHSYDEIVLPESDAAALVGTGADVVAGGHTHLQWTRLLDDALFVNPGSVGLAWDRHAPEGELRATGIAEWAVLHAGEAGVAVEFRRVPFDAREVVEAARRGGRPYLAEFEHQWRAS
jgi:predicted phosphodiesterase